MINITRLWTGEAQPADHLRYGRGQGHGHSSGGAVEGCTPTSSRARKPIVVWNITRTCNLRCIHCYSDSHAAQFDNELSQEQCRAVIDNIAEYQANALLLSGGEPMVHPQFFDILSYATDKGLKVTISTNGTQITPEKAQKIKDLNVAYVGISLDGIGAIHDKFRGKIGAFDQAVQGFKYCKEVGQKTGLRLTLTKNNAESIEEILDFIDAEDIQRVCFYHLVPTGRGVDVQTLTPERARNTIDSLIARAQQWQTEGKLREILTVTQPADGIYLLLRQIKENSPRAVETLRLLQWNGGGANSSGRGIANIDTQGNVHPDQFWQSVHLGNVKTQNFNDIWEGRVSPAKEILPELRASAIPAERQAQLEGRCGRCLHYSLCGGGFRTRAAFANDHWLGSDPGCYLTEEEIMTPIPASLLKAASNNITT